MEVDNHSPFPHMLFEKAGGKNQLFDVLVVAGSFDLVHGQPLPIADEQKPINGADRYVGEPETTGLLEETQLVLAKPRTDIHVLGSARPANEVPASRWPMAVRVGPVHKTAMLTGPRYWTWSVLRGWHLTQPYATDGVALHMGMAYGGRVARRRDAERIASDPHDPKAWDVYKPNPAGIGFFGAMPLDRAQYYPAAQIEDVQRPITGMFKRYAPVAFGPVPRWSPDRARHVGTCDAKWLANDFPSLPSDFNYAFYQSAQPDLVAPGWLEGNEPIALLGCHPEGERHGQLPGMRLLAVLTDEHGHSQTEPLRLDTITIDLDSDTVQLVWRRAIPKAWGLRHALLAAVPDDPPPADAPKPVYFHRHHSGHARQVPHG